MSMTSILRTIYNINVIELNIFMFDVQLFSNLRKVI